MACASAFFRTGAQQRCAHAQINDRWVVAQQRGIHHRSERRLVILQPGDNGTASGYRVEPAGIPEKRFGKIRVDRLQPVEQFPSGLLGNEQIGVLGCQADLVGAVAYAGAQAHADQIEEYGQFVLRERKGAVVTGDHRGGGSQGIRLAH
jgi:hypothetical protein